MAEVDETALAVAEVYARPLLELADEWELTDTVIDEFDDFIAYMETNPDFASFITSPTIDDTQRGPGLERLFRGRMNDLLLDTLLVMNNKERMPIVTAVHASFHALLDAQHQRVEAMVTTATPLTDEQRERVTDVMQRRTGKNVSLSERVEPDLLGGIVVQVGDERIDGSLQRRLAEMRAMLHERASQEVIALRDVAVET